MIKVNAKVSPDYNYIISSQLAKMIFTESYIRYPRKAKRCYRWCYPFFVQAFFRRALFHGAVIPFLFCCI